MSKYIYIICPVRKLPPEVKKLLDAYVTKLEEDKDNHVHYPPRDVDQTRSGMDICIEHSEFMNIADEVHVYWDPESSGSKFDLGMAFVRFLNKPGFKVVIINKVEPTEEKSFTNVLLAFSTAERGYNGGFERPYWAETEQ